MHRWGKCASCGLAVLLTPKGKMMKHYPEQVSDKWPGIASVAIVKRDDRQLCKGRKIEQAGCPHGDGCRSGCESSG